MVSVPGVSPQSKNKDWEQFRSLLLWPLPTRELELDTLHISLIDFFQTSVVMKTEVHDFEKIRFWSSSQNREINASDQQN